jgi:hypothetical protein
MEPSPPSTIFVLIHHYNFQISTLVHEYRLFLAGAEAYLFLSMSESILLPLKFMVPDASSCLSGSYRRAAQ